MREVAGVVGLKVVLPLGVAGLVDMIELGKHCHAFGINTQRVQISLHLYFTYK